MVLPYTSNASTRYVVSVWAGGLSVKDASSTREARVPRELRLGPSQVSNHRLFCLFGGTWGAAHGHYCIGACTTASLILRIGSGAEAEKRVRQGVGRERALPQKQTNKQTPKKKVLILLLVPPSPSSSFLHTAPPPLGHLPPLPEMSATDLPVFVTARWAAPGQEKTKVAPDNVALMSPPLTPLRWRSRPVLPKSESGPSTTSFHSKRIWTKTGTMTGPTQGQIVAPARGCARSSSLGLPARPSTSARG